MKPIANAQRAELYYSKSDGGYYLHDEGLRREWGGKVSSLLGLADQHPDFDQFKRLLHGLDPHSGTQLTAKLVDHRIPAWDLTASVPKGVTTALECGDERIREVLWKANRLAMHDVQAYATTRVRKGGKQEDRVTGNVLWYSDEHPETRPVLDESLPPGHPHREMPDWDRHIHNVLFNVTYDSVEQEWKALKFRPIMDLRKYFDRRFDLYLSNLLSQELGYTIETKFQADKRGNQKYHTWDIQGMPKAVIKRFSRRSDEIEQTEKEIVAKQKRGDAHAPETLSAVERDKLGATSRRTKRDDLTLDDYREFWQGRITPAERQVIEDVIGRARTRQNVRPGRTAEKAVAFAMAHHFEQHSAVPLEQLAITAMERSMGGASPVDIDREWARQGVIVVTINGEKIATTEALQREEERIVGIAAGGRGTQRPVGLPENFSRTLPDGTALNDGQMHVACGLLNTCNRVSIFEGPAGAGKSYSLQKFDEGMRHAGQHVTYLATSSDAVANLAKDGFEVKTLAHFLLSAKAQDAARGGTLVLDEAGMCGHADAVQLFDLAERLDLKLVLVGDQRQHGSVTRGSLLKLLKDHAAIKPFALTEIMRQANSDYRKAATLFSQGKTLDGFSILDQTLGWVKDMANDEERHRHIAADYVRALADKKSVLCIVPTHQEAAQVTQEIRAQLRAAGKLGREEHAILSLVPANASTAERGEATTYKAGDVLVFHQMAKGFAKGDRLTVTDPANVPFAEAGKFQLYRPEMLPVAQGDKLRFLGKVVSVDGKHTLRNGSIHGVAGWSSHGIVLDNGWTIPADAGLLRRGYCDTSFSSQSKTVKRVIVAMSKSSLGAINQEQIYVSSTRAQEHMVLYTDDKAAIKEGIQRSSQKVTALDVLAEQRAKLKHKKRLIEHRARRKRIASLDFVRSAWEWVQSHVQPSRQVRNYGRG